MRRKLAIAKCLKKSAKNFSSNPKHTKIFLKCYHSYVLDCIILGRDSFYLIFGSKYIKGFFTRLSDWLFYFLNVIYKYILIGVAPNVTSPQNFLLIYYPVKKPVHLKAISSPNMIILENFLYENDLYIVDEKTNSNNKIFNIVKA